MPCAICGQEGSLNEKGFCATCAGRLKAMADSSSTLQTVLHPTPLDAGPEPSPRGSTSEPTAECGTSAGLAAPCKILMEFGQSDRCHLRRPFSVALDQAGYIIVMDQPDPKRYRLSLFTADGEFVRTLLEAEQGDGPTHLKYPKGVATDARGNIYIPDAGNNRIQRFDARGTPLGAVGKRGDGPGEFDFPCDVEIDDAGCLYVADTCNSRIQKITPQGVPLLCIGDPHESPDQEAGPDLDQPLGVAVDGDGDVFVADTNHHRVVKYDPRGRLLLTFGKQGRGTGELNYPCDIRVAEDGAIYVADENNTRIQKFDSGGAFLGAASCEGVAADDAAGGDIAIDSTGAVLACHIARHTVIKVELFVGSSSETGGHP